MRCRRTSAYCAVHLYACIDSVRARLLPYLASLSQTFFEGSEEISGRCRNFKSGFHWAKAIIAAGGGCSVSGGS